MSSMKPSAEIIDDIYLEKVLRARTIPMAEKILDGPRLYAYACEAPFGPAFNPRIQKLRLRS